jgi:signal transduction histidine kinase
MTLRERLLFIATSGKYSHSTEEAPMDEILRLIIMNITYSIGSILIIILGISEINVGEYGQGWLYFLIGFFIFLNLMLLWTELPFIVGGSIVTGVFGVFCAILITSDARVEGFTTLWIYTYPLISIFTLGMPLGLLPSLALLAVIVLASAVPTILGIAQGSALAFHICGVYLFILLLAIVYELTRQFKDKRATLLSDKLFEQSLKAYEAQTKAEASNEAKSEFLSRMSHEMRTPMNAIMGMTAIARSAGGDINKMEYCLTKINEASIHLLSVINDILDMSKIEAGKLELNPELFNFNELIERIKSMMQFSTSEKKLEFTIQIAQDIPELVIADDQRLTQVLMNLLSNAVKFTPERGSITLGVENMGRDGLICTLRFSVSDTGIGIPENQRGRLFSRFDQLDGGMARKFGGTGLGLAIAKTIIEHMDGHIWLESEVGKGSKFIFDIQVKEDNSEINNIANVEFINNSASKVPVVPEYEGINFDEGVFAGNTVLLVEDMAINREIVQTLLEETGLSIDCAENGAEALRKFEENSSLYALSLMDVQMPVMDGLETTRKIRELDQVGAKSVPIIAMTANVFREDIEKCLEAGMNDHIGKPFDINEVMKKLRIYINPK